MRKICVVLFILFIMGTLISCATPGSIRQDETASIFTFSKVTPQEFGRCLACQLDDTIPYLTAILREKNDGNAYIFMRGGDHVEFLFDIKKEDGGVKVLFYNRGGRGEDSYLYPLFKQAIEACGVKDVSP